MACEVDGCGWGMKQERLMLVRSFTRLAGLEVGGHCRTRCKAGVCAVIGDSGFSVELVVEFV